MRRLSGSPLRRLTLALALGTYMGPWSAAFAQSEAGFGSPPAGRIPILFNDRHVYVRPTKLEAGRVLGAIARGGALLLPARSLFEAMGARVAYDARTHALRASKPGTDVTVRVGMHSVVIDGETRPLDVPPQLVDGVLYVPFRVISEALGAYVTWIPERRLVAIRYVTAEPGAAPAAPAAPGPTTAAATPLPSASATPAPAPVLPYARFIAVDLSLAPRVANEFTPSRTGRTTQSIRVAFEYKLTLPIISRIGHVSARRSFVEGEYQRFNYPHDGGPLSFANGTPCSGRGGPGPSSGNPGCVTPIGGNGSAYVNNAYLSEEEFALHQSLIGWGHYYVATGLYARRNKYGYPTLRSNFGIGLEALPDLAKRATLYGNAFYYPEVTGNYSPPGGLQQRLRYKLFTYRIGGALTLPNTPFFLDAGFIADHYVGKQNAPASASHSATQLGLGVHF